VTVMVVAVVLVAVVLVTLENVKVVTDIVV
jgi:hypothetical protein